MYQLSAIRQQKHATEQFSRYKFNENLSNKDKKWIRYLWLKGVRWKDIRQIYNLKDATLLETIKMPDNWEAKAA